MQTLSTGAASNTLPETNTGFTIAPSIPDESVAENDSNLSNDDNRLTLPECEPTRTSQGGSVLSSSDCTETTMLRKSERQRKQKLAISEPIDSYGKRRQTRSKGRCLLFRLRSYNNFYSLVVTMSTVILFPDSLASRS